jgi:hypothetical protein
VELTLEDRSKSREAPLGDCAKDAVEDADVLAGEAELPVPVPATFRPASSCARRAFALEASICFKLLGARCGGNLDEKPRARGRTGDVESGVKEAGEFCFGVAEGLFEVCDDG